MKLSHLLEAPLAGISYHRSKSEEGSFSEKDRKLIKQFTVSKQYHQGLYYI